MNYEDKNKKGRKFVVTGIEKDRHGSPSAFWDVCWADDPDEAIGMYEDCECVSAYLSTPRNNARAIENAQRLESKAMLMKWQQKLKTA